VFPVFGCRECAAYLEMGGGLASRQDPGLRKVAGEHLYSSCLSNPENGHHAVTCSTGSYTEPTQASAVWGESCPIGVENGHTAAQSVVLCGVVYLCRNLA